jgi:hypothetical protein
LPSFHSIAVAAIAIIVVIIFLSMIAVAVISGVNVSEGTYTAAIE